VAIDGSEDSMTAVDVAISMAKKNDAELVALHVLRIPNTALYLTLPNDMKNLQEKLNMMLMDGLT
jgi:nucleotide-binding universal stress UspA family protein